MSFFSRRSSTRKTQPVRTQLLFERLEDRTVPATLILGTGGNLSLPHFSTLQAALATANAGDTILVESQGVTAGQYSGFANMTADAAKGATTITVNNPAIPFQVGNLVQISDGTSITTTVIDKVAPASATTSTLTLHNGLSGLTHAATSDVAAVGNTTVIDLNGLTITGDIQPGQTQVSASNIPNLNVWAGTTGVTISNLGLSFGGAITLQGSLTTVQVATAVGGASSATISNVTEGSVTIGDGSSANTISNSTLGALTETGNVANNSGNGGNIVTGNTVTGATSLTGNKTGNTTGDTLSGNTFKAAVTVVQDDGVKFANNTFTVTNGDALTLTQTAGATVIGNTFTVTGVNNRGIVVTQNGVSTAVSATITANAITDTNGTGIAFVIFDGTKFTSNANQNDVRATTTGVDISGDGTAAATAAGTIDLGDTTTAGDNVFRTFTAAQATAGTRSAIYLHNATAGTVSAVANIFDSGVTPASVVRDKTGNTTAVGIYGTATGTVTDTPVETASNAFVSELYRAFTGRAPEAGGQAFWLSTLSSKGGVYVATQFTRTPESLGRIVDNIYLTILGRNSDTSGRNFWIGQLNQGGTVESIIINFLSLPEFYNNNTAGSANPDGAFVQALYTKLLGRAGSASDVAGWVTRLTSLESNGNTAAARANLAQSFVTSAEFRSNYVAYLYGFGSSVPTNPAGAINVLHRTSPPSSAEINAWVNNATLDLLTIEAQIAGSAEGQAQL